MDDCSFDYEDRLAARIVRVHGEVDIYSAPKLETAIAAAGDGAPESLIVDLTDCRYLDSSALRVLVNTRNSLAARMFVVVDGASFVRRLFQIAGLEQHLHVVSDLDALFSKGGAFDGQGEAS
jgi:anti-sigma B factor antagonist